jgi:hypothetical protein
VARSAATGKMYFSFKIKKSMETLCFGGDPPNSCYWGGPPNSWVPQYQ